MWCLSVRPHFSQSRKTIPTRLTRLKSYNDPRPSTNQSISLKNGLTLWSMCFVRTYVCTDGRTPSPVIMNYFSSLCFGLCLGMNQFQMRIVIATGGTVGLAEGIIDVFLLNLFFFQVESRIAILAICTSPILLFPAQSWPFSAYHLRFYRYVN